MAKGLFLLGLYFDEKKYSAIAAQMTGKVKENMLRYGSSYSNWGILLLYHTSPFNEIAIVGKEATVKRNELNQYYLPGKLIAGAITDTSSLDLLRNRFVKDNTLLYVCRNKSCKLPVKNVRDALKLILE